jgi:hypothetical protein
MFFRPQRVGDSKATSIRGVDVPRGTATLADHIPRVTKRLNESQVEVEQESGLNQSSNA